MWGRTEYPPAVCPQGMMLDNTMFITSQCLDARLYQGISFSLVGLFTLLAGLALFSAAFHASRRPGFIQSDTFKLLMLECGTGVGYGITWIVWGAGHGWLGVIAWCVGSEVALSWMAYTSYKYCCISPPSNMDGSTNAWEKARRRMKTQLIAIRAFGFITQIVLTVVDCYYRIQHNRDVSSITKLLIITSWWSSLGISSWIAWTSSHSLAVCITDLCDEMKAASRKGPTNRDGATRSIIELKATAQKILWTGRILGGSCAFMTINNTGVITWSIITIWTNPPKGMMFVSYLLQLFSLALAAPCFVQLWFIGLREIVHKHISILAPAPEASIITTFAQSSGATSTLSGGNKSLPTETPSTLKLAPLTEDEAA
ncbi:hypothetical protein DFS34DRAFT_626760 [Phlyctochytrium arcticum]|nr:hypothetical protein DFS34DRAFT_626760 [Phlyctochytrium arcticum]